MEMLPLASTVGWGFPTWKEDEEAELLAEFGIRRVQIFRNRDLDLPPEPIRDRLASYGIAVTSLHGFFGNDWDPSHVDETARSQAVQGFASEADYCRRLGGRIIVVHPGHAPIGDQTRSPARIDALTRSAGELARIGEKTDVVFALENLQSGQMGDDMAMLRRIVDRFDSPNLALNYDCGHANTASDPITVLEQAGPRIVSTHIHDNQGATDDHFVPGYGNIDMDAVCRGLARVGYRGEFVLELMETTESLRRRCDAAWREKLARWLALASGLEA